MTLGDRPKLNVVRPQNPETAAVLALHQATIIQGLTDGESAKVLEDEEKKSIAIQDAQDGLLARALEEEEEIPAPVQDESEWAPISLEVPQIRRRPAESEFKAPLPRLPKIPTTRACHVCRDLAKCPFISRISRNECVKCLKPVCENCRSVTHRCVKCQRL